MRMRLVSLLCLLGAIVAIPATASAQQQQTFNITFGAFVPQGTDARVTGDVLSANQNFLVFDMDEFRSATVGAEWLVPIGEYFEGGAGISFSRKTVPTVYADYVDNDGTEIDQDLRLRIIPMSFTFRVTPLGRHSPVQPYFGAGLGLFAWRYSESGEFIDFGANRAIFRDTFVASGTQPGAVFLGGIRFGGGGTTGGFEIRHHKASADLDDSFAGPKLDLGGWTYQATLGLRF
jgi:hypothetical protein